MNREEMSPLVEFRDIDELPRLPFGWPHGPGFFLPLENGPGYMENIPFSFLRDLELFVNPFDNSPWPNGVRVTSTTTIPHDTQRELMNARQLDEDSDDDEYTDDDEDYEVSLEVYNLQFIGE